MPCSHPVQHPLVPGGPGLVSLGTLCTKLAWGVPENLKFTWFKKERWRGTLGMELSLKSLCVTHVIEVEKEIVWHTFLKLLSSRNEKKNPLLCLIHFSLSDYYLLLCIQNRKLSRLWNPKEIEKIVRQGTEEMLNPLANCVSLHTVLNIPGLIICSLFSVLYISLFSPSETGLIFLACLCVRSDVHQCFPLSFQVGLFPGKSI